MRVIFSTLTDSIFMSSWFVDDVKHLRNEVYMCLTRNPRWETFSNHSATDEPVGVNSLETIHDQVHEGIGGSETEGHMAIIPVAGESGVILASTEPLTGRICTSVRCQFLLAPHECRPSVVSMAGLASGLVGHPGAAA